MIGAASLRGASLLLVAALFALPCAAQVNVERLRPAGEPGLRTTLDGDFALRTGNTEIIELGIAGRIDLQREASHTFLVANTRYARRDGVRFRNMAFSHLRHTHEVRRMVSVEGFAQVERDAYTLLQLRALVGSGVRLYYFRAEDAHLAHGIAVMAEHERLDAARIGPQDEPAVTVGRLSSYLTLRTRLGEHANLVNTAYVQPRLDDPADLRLLHEAALQVQLGPRVAFQTALNLRYDSRPPESVGSLDLTVRNGIVLRL
jgi:hypothetical protein